MPLALRASPESAALLQMLDEQPNTFAVAR